MFANETELAEAIRNRKSVYMDPGPTGRSPEERARYVLEQCKVLCQTGAYYGKENNRPWQLVDLSSTLSQSSAWVGFEFEMGFHAESSRLKTVNFVWDTINHSAQDREGHGGIVLEATFKPQNFEEYTAGTADILKLYDFLDKENIKLSLPAEGTGYCGTHANISTPLLRRCTPDQARAVVRQLSHMYTVASNNGNPPGHFRLNDGIERHENGTVYPPGYYQVFVPAEVDTDSDIFSNQDLVQFFGRRPYGWCNFRASGHYIEFKIFASTRKRELFLGNYMKTTQALIETIDTLAEAVLADKPVPNLSLKAILVEAHREPVKEEAKPDVALATRVRKAVAA